MALYTTSKIIDNTSFKIGSTIELTLKIEDGDTSSFGDSATVEIKDYWGNPIAIIEAEKLGSDLFVSEFKIPDNLKFLYNRTNQTDVSETYYYLKDIWTLPDVDSTKIESSLLVLKQIEAPVSTNSLYSVVIKDLEVENLFPIQEHIFTFTSTVSDYYASIEDVKNLISDNNLNNIDILKEIITWSQYVDENMRPSIIKNHSGFLSAARCYVKNMVAAQFLREKASVESESRTLDTLQITKKYSKINSNIDLIERAEKCALILLAGGEGSPFLSERFEKGLYDPNRPNISRSKIDPFITFEPWLNSTSLPFITMQADGNVVELRGFRTIRTKMTGI